MLRVDPSRTPSGSPPKADGAARNEVAKAPAFAERFLRTARIRSPVRSADEEGRAAVLPDRPAAWRMPDGAPRLGISPAAECSARAIERVDRVERVLVGSVGGVSEARILIDRGPLAGAEIHLRPGVTGIEVAVLTSTDRSRQTLSSAMQEVATRLRRRGLVLRASFVAREQGQRKGGQER